jgi:hypothetical protein
VQSSLFRKANFDTPRSARGFATEFDLYYLYFAASSMVGRVSVVTSELPKEIALRTAMLDPRIGRATRFIGGLRLRTKAGSIFDGGSR